MKQNKNNRVADDYSFGGNVEDDIKAKGFEIVGEINLPMHAYYLKGKDGEEEVALAIGGATALNRELCHRLTEAVGDVLKWWRKESEKSFSMGRDFWEKFTKHCDETGRTITLEELKAKNILGAIKKFNKEEEQREEQR